MNRTAVIFLLIVALASAAYENKTEDDFLKASEKCMNSLNIPQSYKPKFDKFEYPDEPIVQSYLRCIWMDLQLWDDKNGFSVEHIAELYKDKANAEVLIPILNDCNRNAQNETELKWLYRSFMCILESRVGTWFKEDVTKHSAKSK